MKPRLRERHDSPKVNSKWRVELHQEPKTTSYQLSSPSPSVLVRFHAADKDTPETGKFTKERGLTGLTVPHGWRSLTIMVEGKEEQVTSYTDGSRQKKRACAGKLHVIEPSDFMRLIHYHKNSMGEIAPMIQLSFTRSHNI